MFSALLHFSLAGGFSANRVVGVLRETSYLTGEGRDQTYRRLLETTQAIMDYMVRLLHFRFCVYGADHRMISRQ